MCQLDGRVDRRHSRGGDVEAVAGTVEERVGSGEDTLPCVDESLVGRVRPAGAVRTRVSTRMPSRSSARSTAACVRRAMRCAVSDRSEVAAVSACLLSRAIEANAASASAPQRVARAISSTAQAVGVLSVVCATSSATLRSTSCPSPVSTGIGDAAMARAMRSASKTASSLRAPPPRITTTASRSIRRDSVVTAAATISSANVALHPGVDHGERGPHGAALAVRPVEVVPRGSADAGDHPDAQGDRRQWAALVGIEQAVGDQPSDHLVVRRCDVTECVLRVDAGHLQADPAVGGVVVEVAEKRVPSCRRRDEAGASATSGAAACGRWRRTGR